MIWHRHSELEGTHAYLGASQCAWLNYDGEKLARTYKNHLAIERGTKLHEFAATCISLNQKLQDTGQTLNRYVNDAIGFGLKPEVVLYYSPFCYGTTDAIRYDEEANFLRIHDLKTGSSKPHPEQLRIYAALFCLEYHIDPMDINYELRLYYKDDILIDNGVDGEKIKAICDKIVKADKILTSIRGEMLL